MAFALFTNGIKGFSVEEHPERIVVFRYRGRPVNGKAGCTNENLREIYQKKAGFVGLVC